MCSGRATERAGLDKAIDIIRDGDTLVVWKLDRIGRSLPNVVGLVGDLQKRGVGLKVLTGDIDTTTVTGGRIRPSSYYDRIVDVMDELVRFTVLLRPHSAQLVDRYSERKDAGVLINAATDLSSIATAPQR